MVAKKDVTLDNVLYLINVSTTRNVLSWDLLSLSGQCHADANDSCYNQSNRVPLILGQMTTLFST